MIAYVEKNKPYLDPDLDLRQLSELSGIPSHMISMLLNIHLNRNFYTFINTYRVDEAKKLLSSEGSREMNILTIAYDSGFNSKSTFNMVFRKLEGMTPSEYRNKISSNLQYSHN
ncbi:MAG TPA: helix-turn-helix domain-containing protein [Clostridia bacterium]|nr:helix-turn-helix domain-containing protein [Clostridia bacterium]